MLKQFKMGEIDEKFKLWKKASQGYYNGNIDDVIMSDEEFDDLTDELIKSGIPEIVNCVQKTVPTKEFNIPSEFEDVNRGLLLSLFKIKFKNNTSYSEIAQFFKKVPENCDLYLSPKYDGCSIRIVNESDNYNITTKGGQNVTEKLMKIPSVESAIKTFPHLKCICGELLIAKDLFKEKYSDQYQNPRNFVSGYLNSKDACEYDCNDFTFIPYTDGVNPIPSMWTNIGHYPLTTLALSQLQLMDYFNNKLKSDNFKWLCDGIVLGYSTTQRIVKDNYPLNMVAIKFPSKRVITKVINIEWSEKKLGNLIPIICVEPVELDGSTITKCSGYNYQYLKDNKIGIGSIVQITKSGDIIPIIVKTITKSTNIPYPENCYVNGKHLKRFENSEIIKNKFILGLQSFDIKGIGDVQAKLIGEICDYDIVEFFNPNKDLEFINKLSNKPALYKIVCELRNCKQILFSELIYALQFDNVGKIISKKIALLLTKKSTDITNISQYIKDNILRGEGFGKIKNSCEKLKSYGIKIVYDQNIDDDTISFEMTGNPPGMTKDEFVNKIMNIYGKQYSIQHTVLTKTTKFLITDNINSNSGKMMKARKYNIKILTYQNILTNGFKN